MTLLCNCHRFYSVLSRADIRGGEQGARLPLSGREENYLVYFKNQLSPLEKHVMRFYDHVSNHILNPRLIVTFFIKRLLGSKQFLVRFDFAFGSKRYRWWAAWLILGLRLVTLETTILLYHCSLEERWRSHLTVSLTRLLRRTSDSSLHSETLWVFDSLRFLVYTHRIQ